MDVDNRPPVTEPRDAPSPQPADDGEAASMSVESLQGAPEGDASPGVEGTDASAPEVIVITDKTSGLLLLLLFNCCAYCTLLMDTLKNGRF